MPEAHTKSGEISSLADATPFASATSQYAAPREPAGSLPPVIGRLSEDNSGVPPLKGRLKIRRTLSSASSRTLPRVATPRSNLREVNFEADLGSSLEGRAPTPEETSRNRLAFGLLLVAVCIINSTFSLMAPIFPQEAAKRGLLPVVTGLIFSIYSFCNFFVSPLHGWLMQRRYVKRRTMLMLGLVLSSLASAGFGLSIFIPEERKVSFAVVTLALRMLNGVGAAAVDTASMAMVTGLFKDSDYFGTALGILESCLALGWMIGPLAGGYLASAGGFSAPFYTAALAGVLLLPIPFIMPDGQSGVQKVGHSSAQVSPLQLLQHTEIAVLMLDTVAAAAAITFLDATLAPFLQDTAGFSTAAIGMCFSCIAAAYAVATILAGWLSDMTSPLRVIIAGQLLCVLPYALLGPSPPLRPILAAAGLLGPWMIWASLVLVGAGCAFCLMPVLPAILAAADKRNLSRDGLEDLVSGLVGGAYYLGGGAGPLIGGALAALLGFEWATTAWGLGLLAFTVILVLTTLLTRGKPKLDQDVEQPLLVNGEPETA